MNFNDSSNKNPYILKKTDNSDLVSPKVFSSTIAALLAVGAAGIVSNSDIENHPFLQKESNCYDEKTPVYSQLNPEQELQKDLNTVKEGIETVGGIAKLFLKKVKNIAKA